MKKLMEIVNDRNAIVEGLDEDRLRSVSPDIPEHLGLTLYSQNWQ